MLNWNLKVSGETIQKAEENTYIGGKPKIPPEIVIPKCSMCDNELTFMFQIEFPPEHEWYGKSLAVFFCTKNFHDEYCIPEFPHVPDLYGVEVTSDFLKQYERNFKVIVFDSDKGQIREDYEEKVAYKSLYIASKNCEDLNSDFVLGGEPTWIMGMDETPHSIDGKELTLLLQVKEDYLFQTVPLAPPQVTSMGRPRNDSNYKLFVSDRIYFWGVKDKSIPLVYISVQAP